MNAQLENGSLEINCPVPNTSPIHQKLRQRILLCGATGTIGQATSKALIEKGYEVICLIRRPNSQAPVECIEDLYPFLKGTTVLIEDFNDPKLETKLQNKLPEIDVIVSCLASRTGLPKDAWQIDYAAHVHLLNFAKKAGVSQFIQLSAICLQKPKLAFQEAKLAFEKLLIESGISYTIIRPTAFFKSLSGQIERIKKGKPFLVFGNGQLTACKPISDRDLANFIANCLANNDQHNKILPIGGPGNAITPIQQAALLFKILQKEPSIKKVPLWIMDVIIHTLSLIGIFLPKLRDKAELAKIGKYYATESMLVLNPQTGRYHAELTPSTGKDTLDEYYSQVINDHISVNLREHAVF